MQSNANTNNDTDTDMSNSSNIRALTINWNEKNYKEMARNIITALTEQGSDRVRAVLNGIRIQLGSALFYMFRDDLNSKHDHKDEIKYMLGVPFFCLKLQSEEVQVKTRNKSKQNMPSAASSVGRVCIHNFLGHQVYFEKYDAESELIASGSESESVPALNATDDDAIANALVEIIVQSCKGVAAECTLEPAEVNCTLGALNNLLKLCGYKFVQKKVPDFTIRKTSSTEKDIDIVHGEAKRVIHLPQNSMTAELSVNLCRFGFATKIVRNIYEEKDHLKEKALQNLLGLPDIPTSKTTNGGNQGSTMVDALLQFSDNQLDNTIKINDLDSLLKHEQNSQSRREIIKSAKMVKTSLEEKIIGPNDALNLWCATMQACEASLVNNKKFTVVLSGRMMWFVKLDIVSGKCTVRIGDGMLIGEAGFTQKLIAFIKCADHSDGLPDGHTSKWDSSLGRNVNSLDEDDNEGDATEDNVGDATDDDKDDDKDETINKKRKLTDSNTQSDDAGQILPSKISRAVSTDNSSSPINSTGESPPRIMESADGFTNNIVSGMDTTTKAICKNKSKSKRMTNEEQMMWQRAFTGLGNADMKYLDQDQDGVIIPYLHQLKEVEVEGLGDGRCGTVKKIRWNNGFAAMKEYVLDQEDDNILPCDVYEHELKVFYRLKSLWGQYVPRLLFHTSWSCCPSIGMEVGQPMDHDFNKWTEEDKDKMRKTIAKIEEKGLRQDDCRASNFVRLNNGSIAMIDFEAVVEISS